ncbi:MAG: N-acetylmuramoyl-L-alanine amidase [Oscillospiraceae bacterium]|nr:N-acetylmuramoyl-L-alanine amidase [Oscillospiraceae bacterium]
MKKSTKLTVALAAALLITSQSTLYASAVSKATQVQPSEQVQHTTSINSYNDYEVITNTGVDIYVPQALSIANPSKNMKTTASAYYITGTSNPAYKLYLNGNEVENRGMYGSFGVFASLNVGDNVFTFKQGENTKTITITRVASSSQLDIVTTENMTSLRPSVQDIARPAAKYTLRCVAPSGASVYAVINGERVDLKQVAATAVPGVAATFTASYQLPNVSKPKEIGAVQYVMYYNGKTTSASSEGSIFVVPQGGRLVAEVNQAMALSYAANNTASNFTATLHQGATDYITDASSYVAGQSADMFKISTGWIAKQCVTILPEISNCYNKVSDITFDRGSKSEQLVLSGTANSMYKAYETNEALTVILYNTGGIDSIPMKKSSIFSGVTVTRENDAVKMVFTKKSPQSLWGYNVEYDKNDTIIYFKKPPVLSSSSKQPLKGITVALDAGHGGNDNGAAGTAGLNGPTEKDLTLAAVLATQKRLESLGADVIVTRSDDSTMSMDERMFISEAKKADFFISMHYNSIATGANASNAKGIEVYYYHDQHIDFGKHMLDSLTTATGRKSRGVKFNIFRVTLNTYAPSLLLELGFICNPVEYDDICDPQNLYQTANAVAEGIIATLK